MEAEDPLSQLADIHLPGDPGIWPPAPGWWLVAALVLLALLLLARQQLRVLLLKRRLQTALQELDVVHQRWLQAATNEEHRNAAGLALLYGFNTILKRVALVTCDPSSVPRLTGQDWLQFLDQFDQGHDFTRGPGQVLGDGTYRPVFNADVGALHALCRHWVTRRFLQRRELTAAPTAAKGTEVRA